MKSLAILFKILAISVICLLYSCAKSSLQGDFPGDEEGETEVLFSLQLPRAAVPSRGLDLNGNEENYIETIDVFVFNPQNNQYLYSRRGYGLDTNDGSSTRTFTVSLVPGTVDLVILANARDLLLNSFPSGITAGISRADLEKALLMTGSGKWNTTPTDAAYRHIPMFGEKKSAIINTDTDLTGSNGIDLIRMVARVDISLATAAASDFTLSEAYVYNYQQKAQVMPASANWNYSASRVSGPSVPTGENVTKGPLVYTLTGTATAFAGDIYLFEAAAGSKAAYLGNTCLVVGGIYEGKLSYYRIDFIDSSSGSDVYLPILRNNRYMVEIQKIAGPGHENPEDAFQSLPINITASIVRWNETEMTDIYDDGQYFFSTSANPVVLSGMAGTGELKIQTDCPNWKYVLSSNVDPDASVTAPGWVTMTSGHIQNTVYTTTSANLAFSVDRNTTGSARYAYIHIWSGRFVITVTIMQEPWYIGRAAISPDDMEAKSGGEQYTVTLQGYFPGVQIPIRVRTSDGTTLDENLVTGVTSGDLTTGSATLDLPAYWLTTDGSRFLVFEYQNIADETWLQIIAPEQKAYWVRFSTDDPDINDFTGWGSYMNVKVEGNFPALPIRFGDATGKVAINGVSFPNIPAGQTGTYRIYVPYNDENTKVNRTINFQYWNGSYNMDGTESWSSPFSISQRQGNKIVEDYDLYTDKGATYVASTYRSSNRVVSHMDYDKTLNDWAVCKNWYQAMGIPEPANIGDGGLHPDLRSYPNSYTLVGSESNKYLNDDYTPKVRTGCGAYTERDYENLGDWVLPTYLEANWIKWNWDIFQHLAGVAYGTGDYTHQYVSLFTATEASIHHYWDEYGSFIDGMNTQQSYIFQSTSILVATNAGINTDLNYSNYYMMYYRKNGTAPLNYKDNAQTRCVRTWNPATDIGGPGYSPTFSW